jgi:hypothetical protein
VRRKVHRRRLAMDDTKKLILELHHKLAELDLRVWQYRQDMAGEFTRYKEELLRGVQAEVAETVSKAIAKDMKSYESLGLDDATVESCKAAGSTLANGVQNTAPLYQRTATTAYQRPEEPDSPRSPHERELELQGVFTPSYLPLLDSTNRNERRSPSATISPSSERGMENFQVDASTDTRSLAPSPELRRPPTPKRKNTDEASVTSDTSDGVVRRSALRRSSSSGKPQSPRRVRFEVMGEEVLPTSSPLPNSSILAADTSPIPQSLERSSEDEGEDEDEQIEDIEEPPPRRISSSQALRALSKAPLEEGTEWTTVSSDPDGSSVRKGNHGSPTEDLQGEDETLLEKPGSYGRSDIRPANIVPTSKDTSLLPDNIDDAETPSDDDDMLDMSPLKPMKSHKSATILSPIETANISDNKSPTAATRTPSKPWLTLESVEHGQEEGEREDLTFGDDDQGVVFPFDEDVNDQSSPSENEPDESNSGSPESPETGKEDDFVPRSPARSIPPKLASLSSSVAKPMVGSYKGHPFSMPIVSDELHAQAASLGNVNSFVGSLDGRSGLDENNIQSFRESFRGTGGIGSFTGGKSMSERMMMDDLLNREEPEKSKKKT